MPSAPGPGLRLHLGEKQNQKEEEHHTKGQHRKHPSWECFAILPYFNIPVFDHHVCHAKDRYGIEPDDDTYVPRLKKTGMGFISHGNVPEND